MSLLFESSIDFQQEMLFCFIQLVGIGNYYQYNHNWPFTYWNTNVQSCQFLSALMCCVLQMLLHIAEDASKQDT